MRRVINFARPWLSVAFGTAIAVCVSFGAAFATPAKLMVFGTKPNTVFEIRKNNNVISTITSTALGRLWTPVDVTAGNRFDLLGGVGAPTAVEPPTLNAALGQNYPNPFNPSTRIPFSLAVAGPVVVRVFDVRGAHVATIHDGTLATGNHSFEWSGRDDNGQPVASGMYLYTLVTGGQTLSKKMLLVK